MMAAGRPARILRRVPAMSRSLALVAAASLLIPLAARAAPPVLPAAVTESCARFGTDGAQATCARCGKPQVGRFRRCERACFAKHSSVLRGDPDLDARPDPVAAAARDDCLDGCRATLQLRIDRCMARRTRK